MCIRDMFIALDRSCQWKFVGEEYGYGGQSMGMYAERGWQRFGRSTFIMDLGEV